MLSACSWKEAAPYMQLQFLSNLQIQPGKEGWICRVMHSIVCAPLVDLAKMRRDVVLRHRYRPRGVIIGALGSGFDICLTCALRADTRVFRSLGRHAIDRTLFRVQGASW